MMSAESHAVATKQQIQVAVDQCTLGGILVAFTASGVCAVLLGDDPDELIADLGTRFSKDNLIAAGPGASALAAQVISVVDGHPTSVPVPLDVRGTEFQQRVWQALRDIPSGATQTYSDVAEAIGSPSSVRAVASACGANSIAVLIPCHRVVRKGGGLSGYRWGVERKRELLNRESIQ